MTPYGQASPAGSARHLVDPHPAQTERGDFIDRSRAFAMPVHAATALHSVPLHHPLQRRPSTAAPLLRALGHRGEAPYEEVARGFESPDQRVVA